MRLILLFLSVFTINSQHVNENSSTQSTIHFLPAQLPLSSNAESEYDSFSNNEHNEGHEPFHPLGSGTGSNLDLGGGGSTSSNFGGTSGESRSRIIETKYGKVQGLSITIAQGRTNPLRNKIVEVYVGIPYASAPIKSHRFGPTQTAVPWEGIKDAVKPGFVCPQMMPDIHNESLALKEMPRGYFEYLKKIEPYLRNQSEDCLYLNIYTPIGPEPKVRPVLVYIHGGKFAWGSGNLSDGTVLAAYGDVVFVSLNYRLNVLGFLNVNAIPNSKPRVANYGLMDQIAALHWIKENILKFGGDPENITLMGYESGAACIHYLMASPAVTPGLFHRAVLIAGSAHAPWALVSDPSSSAAALAQALNCSLTNSTSTNSSTSSNSSVPFTPHHPLPPTPAPYTSSSRDGKSSSSAQHDPVFDCIKNKHFSEFSSLNPPKFSVDFGPSIDGVVIKPNFRATSDSQMGKRDVSKKYDLLFGLSSLEKMTAFSEVDLQQGFEGQRRDAILRTLIRNSYRFHLNEILATITNEYTDWEKSSQHPIPTRDLTLSAVTDCLSLAPVVAVSESSQVNRGFFYVFEHATKEGLYNYFTSQGQRTGGVGGEELNYMLGTPLVEALTGQVLPFIPPPIPSNYTKAEMALSELLITFLSNFAHSGDPNEPQKGEVIWPVSKERNRYKSTPWEMHDRLHQKYLEISANKIRGRTHYRAHQMAIWLRLVPELQRSGASFATGLHNRMKGGNDPSLYVGKLRQPLDGDDALLHTPSLLDIMGYRGEELLESLQEGVGASSLNLSGNPPPAPPTTCFSPLASSSSPSLNGRGQGQGLDKFNHSLIEPSFFSPYSTALSVTIAIGCSLLILNVFIFALVYYQRDKKRAEILKSSSQQSQSTLSSKYGEPPELLKSNSTTCTSLHHSSSQPQLQGLQLVQQQSTDSNISNQSQPSQSGCGGGTNNQQFGSPLSQSSQQLHHHHQTQQQLAQQALAQRGILLSPTQAHQGHPNAHLYHHHLHHQNQHQHPQQHPQQGQISQISLNSHYASNSNAMAVATLPRSNGGVGISSGTLPKPPPPPRSFSNFSTLPHNINRSSQNLNYTNFDELKV